MFLILVHLGPLHQFLVKTNGRLSSISILTRDKEINWSFNWKLWNRLLIMTLRISIVFLMQTCNITAHLECKSDNVRSLSGKLCSQSRIVSCIRPRHGRPPICSDLHTVSKDFFPTLLVAKLRINCLRNNLNFLYF